MEPDKRIDWYRIPIPVDQLRRLSTPVDWKGWRQAGGSLALVVLSAALALWVHFNCAWYWLIPALFLHGTTVTNTVAGVHELVHERVFTSLRLNRAFLYIISFITWWNPRFFLISHKEHHKFTLHQPEDLEVILPMRFQLGQILRGCIIDPLGIYHRVRQQIRHIRGHYVGEWEQRLMHDGGPAARKWVADWARILLIGHGAILVVSLAFGLWIVPLLVSCAAFYGGAVMWLMHVTQHVGLVDQVNDFRLCCRTIKLNPVLQFLYWNMNYHTEHHMYPAVPCYNLQALYEATKHEMPRPRNGLFETWVEIAHILIRQKYEPGYEYRVPLPTDPVAATGEPRNAPPPPATPRLPAAKVWECMLCGFIYDERLGLPEEGIAPGTRWDDIPDDWQCPVCGMSKSQFRMVEITASQPPARVAADTATAAEPIVIVGSGIAGFRVAQEIRNLDATTPVVLVTADEGASYYKPALSNALARNQTPDDLVLADHAEMARRLNLQIRTHTRATAIDREARRLITTAGPIAYRKLVLALGARQIPLNFGGARAEALLTVNNLADYRRFRDALRPGAAVLIVGAGLIGCEFANDLALAGHTVHVCDLADAPLSQLVPSPVGQALARELAALGVQWHLGRTVQAIDAGATGPLACRLSDGEPVEADIVLAAVGLLPITDLARAAGLDCARGIVVDASLATSDPHIFALGDCAELEGAVRPYVQPILEAAPVLARNLFEPAASVALPVMPVVVKTPSCPIAAVPPPRGEAGQWELDGADRDLRARFVAPGGALLGFALAGAATQLVDQFTADCAAATGTAPSTTAGAPVLAGSAEA